VAVSLLPFAFALAGCGRAPLPTATIMVGDVPLRVEVAADPRARRRGLMHRESLSPDAGMLFVYPDEAERTFWMKNVRFPLSVAFADREGRIFSIADLEPGRRSRARSGAPASYVLEVHRGWFRAHGIEVGATLGDLPARAAR
jgi:uncharacterized membrane protein (UPF0127 family)